MEFLWNNEKKLKVLEGEELEENPSEDEEESEGEEGVRGTLPSEDPVIILSEIDFSTGTDYHTDLINAIRSKIWNVSHQIDYLIDMTCKREDEEDVESYIERKAFHCINEHICKIMCIHKNVTVLCEICQENLKREKEEQILLK